MHKRSNAIKLMYICKITIDYYYIITVIFVLTMLKLLLFIPAMRRKIYLFLTSTKAKKYLPFLEENRTAP